MIALVTGATGFIGQHLVWQLLSQNHEVVAVEHDRVVSFPRQGGVLSVVRGDVRDLEFLRRALSRHQVDTVFHLAAQTQVTLAHADPAAELDANVRGTWTVLEACRLEHVPRVIVASSDKVYGECKDATEDFNLGGHCSYSVSKIMADRLATMYGVNYDLCVAITRMGNVYGPGDTHWRRLVPGACRAAVKGEPYALRTDGSGVRDYLYVDDAVQGYYNLVTCARDKVGAFNFSGSEPKTVKEVVYDISEYMARRPNVAGHPRLQITYEPDATPEIKHQTLCCDKAKAEVMWRPVVTFERGIALTVDWYKRNVGSVNY